MSKFLFLIRWFVGLLFIFSGLIKANDPLGLSYKMQEFFEAWHWEGLNEYTLGLSVFMNAFEILAGVALLLGWKNRWFHASLLGLIVFFTFLTAYASMATNPDGSLKFRSCGCFGDCIPLDPFQSFLKDLVLLVFIILLVLQSAKTKLLFQSARANAFSMFLALVLSVGSQFYTLTYLPVVDCLPFRPGNDLLEQRRMPENAVPDSFDIRFIYKKGETVQEFRMNELPDSTWTFVDRKQVLVKKGKNNEPAIKDFILKDSAGEDVTENVLQQKGIHYLLFIQKTDDLKQGDDWVKAVKELTAKARVHVVTSVPESTVLFFRQAALSNQVPVLSCDVTAIKTAARAIPVLYKMQGSKVMRKWSSASSSSWN